MSSSGLPSEIVGTAALWVGLIVAILIAAVTRPDRIRLATSIRYAIVVLALQSLHFAEEFVTGFYRLFPQRLGLHEWSAEFFVAFNAVWLALWLGATAAAIAHRFTAIAAALLWFLAIAAVGNGIAHPVLAVLTGGYFPGLITAPILGVAGILLIRDLGRQADPRT
jgi:hypothetical protein